MFETKVQSKQLDMGIGFRIWKSNLHFLKGVNTSVNIYYPAGPSSAIDNDVVPRVEIGQGILLQIIAEGRNLNAVQRNLPNGSLVQRHNHPQEQFGYVIRGALEITIDDGDKYMVEEGDSYVIPSNAYHKFKAVGEPEAIDVFTPPRDLTTAGGK